LVPSPKGSRQENELSFFGFLINNLKFCFLFF